MKAFRSLAVAIVVLTGNAAYAQDAGSFDAKWTPWLGCWRLLQEDLRDAAVSLTGPGTSSVPNRGSEEIMVCVLPGKTHPGVEMATVVGGRPVLQQTIVADGVNRPVTEPDCAGQQSSEWSRNARRLFTRGEVECKGQPKRVVSGIGLMMDGPTWIDIQAVQIDQDQDVRVRRYRRTGEMPAELALPADLGARASVAAAQFAAGASMTLDEVIEASSKIASPAVEAALVETSSRFNLDSRTLERLDAAGVPDDVIDLMVALSFPGRFKDERTSQFSRRQDYGSTVKSTRQSTAWGVSGWYGGSYLYDPYASYYLYYPYYSYYPYYPYYYPYYYSPFGYSNWWGRNTPRYYFGRSSSSIAAPGTPLESRSGKGRVIQGRGYTRVRPGGAVNPPSPQQSTSEGDGNTRSGSGGSVSGPSSGRSAVSRQGYSSGGLSSGAGSSSGGGSRSSGGSISGGSSSSGSGSSSNGGSGSGSGSNSGSSGRTAQPR
jgi:hypothetical protein